MGKRGNPRGCKNMRVYDPVMHVKYTQSAHTKKVQHSRCGRQARESEGASISHSRLEATQESTTQGDVCTTNIPRADKGVLWVFS